METHNSCLSTLLWVHNGCKGNTIEGNKSTNVKITSFVINSYYTGFLQCCIKRIEYILMRSNRTHRRSQMQRAGVIMWSAVCCMMPLQVQLSKQFVISGYDGCTVQQGKPFLWKPQLREHSWSITHRNYIADLCIFWQFPQDACVHLRDINHWHQTEPGPNRHQRELPWHSCQSCLGKIPQNWRRKHGKWWIWNLQNESSHSHK